jgi:protein-S-isoprenylcysteine O-methyltransferase Ste14
MTGTASKAADSSGAIIHPPIAWALAFIGGLAIDWSYPLSILPIQVPNVWLGAMIFAAGLMLALWAIMTMRKAGTALPVNRSTTVIVESGPYRYSRNPIYIGMFLGQAGLAAGFNSLWILLALVPFYIVIRYGVIASEESYLERKFGEAYLSYKSRIRRWL